MIDIIELKNVWEYGIDEAIKENSDYINFTTISQEDLRNECLDYIKYCFDNDMIGLEVNYKNVVIDTAKTYEAWEG